MPKMQFEDRLRYRKESVGSDYEKTFQVFIADRKRQGCTNRTIEWYEEVLGRYFREFLEEKQLPLEPAKWISSDIEDYMGYLLKERNCKPVTCKNRFSALRAWCNFLITKGYIETNPMAALALMKVKKEVVKTLPDEVLDILFKRPSLVNCTFADFRNRALIWTLFDTGIRVNELANICIKDLYLDEGYILITHGKGQKERLVGISKKLYKVLTDFLEILEQSSKNEHLFCNSYGEKLSKETIRKRLHDCGKSLGIED